MAAWRRLVTRPERLEYSADAWMILGLIALLMVTDALADGARIAGGAPGPWQWTPVSAAVGGLLANGSIGTLHTVYAWSWWIHAGALYLFANYLPYSKHFHVYTSLPERAAAAARAGRQARNDGPREHRRGQHPRRPAHHRLHLEAAPRPLHLHRVRALHGGVPDAITHKPLVPRDLTIGLRNHLNASEGEIIRDPGDAPGTPQCELAGEVVDPDAVWACTSCRWCEEACPLFISYVDKIVDMRRHLVLEKATFPEEAEIAFRGMEVNGNPWQLPAENRADWAKGLDVPLAGDGGGFDVLFWVGCAGAYDEAGRRPRGHWPALLKAAGIRFAILGHRGDVHRRLGAAARQRVPVPDARAGQRQDAQPLRGDEDRHQLPALPEHPAARVPRLRRALRGGARHPARGGAAGRGQAQAHRGRSSRC